MTTITAQQRRAILANAHAAWFRDAERPQIDAVHNLKQALVQTKQLIDFVTIADVRLEGTTICIFIDCGDYTEVIELDAYGNTLRGHNMKTAVISLCFVRMALHRPSEPNMLPFAVSTRYAPALNHDGTLLHGQFSILSTSNQWSSV